MSNESTNQAKPEKLNRQIHRSFVHPSLCEQLTQLGLTAKVPYHWKIKGDEALLYTSAFDIDNYYTEAEQITNIALDKIIPAYQASDIEPAIGLLFHFINKDGTHEVSPQRQRAGAGIKKATRYCDALAMVLIEMLKRQSISAEKANQAISH